MLLGSHISIAGGLPRVIERARVIGATAIQIFSKNNNRWTAPAFTAEQLRAWEEAAAGFPRSAMAIHDSYLVNLCSPDQTTLTRSYDAFVDEHRRAAQLGITLLNFHPGSARGRTREAAIALVADAMNRAHEETDGSGTISVIETTAGQGSALGGRFEEIAAIIDAVHDKSRVAVCMDTCHVFAAGYDIRTEAGYESTMQEFDAVIGLNRLALMHLNDSKAPLGSNVDRHEHIGRGRIGETAFRMVMTDSRLENVPMVLETAKSSDMHEDIENLELLRGFHRGLPESSMKRPVKQEKE